MDAPNPRLLNTMSDAPDRFADRRDAGRLLGEHLSELGLGRNSAVDGPVVLGLPRGGVPVASEVALRLDAPLDVLVVRKIGLPGNPEVAMGAVGEHGAVVWNRQLVEHARVDDATRAVVEARERAEVEARVRRFRGGRAAVAIGGRTTLLVDDGVATGATARVACQVARRLGAARVVLATPVAAPDAVVRIVEADDVVALRAPLGFTAVGMHYVDFSQTPDAEVVAVLAAHAA